MVCYPARVSGAERLTSAAVQRVRCLLFYTGSPAVWKHVPLTETWQWKSLSSTTADISIEQLSSNRNLWPLQISAIVFLCLCIWIWLNYHCKKHPKKYAYESTDAEWMICWAMGPCCNLHGSCASFTFLHCNLWEYRVIKTWPKLIFLHSCTII